MKELSDFHFLPVTRTTHAGAVTTVKMAMMKIIPFFYFVFMLRQ